VELARVGAAQKLHTHINTQQTTNDTTSTCIDLFTCFVGDKFKESLILWKEGAAESAEMLAAAALRTAAADMAILDVGAGV
jgi:hypothetical protein